MQVINFSNPLRSALDYKHQSSSVPGSAYAGECEPKSITVERVKNVYYSLITWPCVKIPSTHCR